MTISVNSYHFMDLSNTGVCAEGKYFELYSFRNNFCLNAIVVFGFSNSLAMRKHSMKLLTVSLGIFFYQGT